MKHANRLWTAIAVGLALLVVAQVTRFAGDAALAPVEPSTHKVFELSETTLEFLEQLDDELLLTYYTSPRAALPSPMRHLRSDVELVLGTLAEAADGKVHVEIVVPDEVPELREYLTELGLSSFRARSVEHDGWSEAEVWSSLRISRGAASESILHAITSEMVPGLQSLIVEQVRAEVKLPRVTLAAPAGEFTALEQLLGSRADVTRIDLDQDPAALPSDTDLLFWMNPSGGSASHLRALASHVELGRPAVIAAAPYPSHDPTFTTLFAEYGVPIAGELQSANQPLLCTAHDQDFRPLGAQPNGNLMFGGAHELHLDQANLQERNRNAHALASSTEGARSPLLLLLNSEDPFRGSLVLAASSTPFSDEALANDTTAHRGLVRILVEELASPSTLVWNRASVARFQRIAELSPKQRSLWRGFTLLLVPAAWILLAVLRLSRSRRTAGSSNPARGLPWQLGLALGACALSTLAIASLNLEADATAHATHSISTEEIRVLERAVAGHSIAQLELFLSPPADLPPELRLPARRARAWCSELASQIDGLAFSAPPSSEAEADERLEPRLVTSTSDETTRVRRVIAGLRIRLGEASTVLTLTESADYANLRFRIAFAFWKLSEQREVRVGIAASAGILSAAEGEFDYRAEGLFAPTEGDRFAHARRLLSRSGFELTALDPNAPDSNLEADLVMWLQPRRDIGAMLTYASAELASGGNVLLAAQHYEIVPRQLRRDEMALSFWPRPLHTDLERDYLPGLGIELTRSLFFDRESVPLELGTRIERRLERGAGGHELEAQFSAQPFLVRALASNFGEPSVMRGVGDLVLNSPNQVRFESDLGDLHGIRATPLVRSTENVWHHDWSGGNLEPALLEGPLSVADMHMPFRRSLATLFEGRFPEAKLERESLPNGKQREFYSPGAAHSGPEGKLLLVGSASMFEDDALGNEEFDNGQFLLHSTIGLTLGDEFTSIASRRLVTPGFERPDSSSRLGWRVFVLGAGPLAGLLFALFLFTVRGRGARDRIPAQ